jgi:hypothetical protein
VKALPEATFHQHKIGWKVAEKRDLPPVMRRTTVRSGWRVGNASAALEGQTYTFLHANDEKVQSKRLKTDPPPPLSVTLNANTLHTLHFFQKVLILIGVTGGGLPSTDFVLDFCKVLRLIIVTGGGSLLVGNSDYSAYVDG